MSIQITVIDPANTNVHELRAVLNLLSEFAGCVVLDADMAPSQLREQTGAYPVGVDVLRGEDNPETGAPVVPPNEAFSAAAGNPAMAFANNDPAHVFGMHNVMAAAATVETPEVVWPFGQGAAGNEAGAAPSTTTSGTPPAPNNGGATAGGLDLDSRGIPFDPRIHASNKDGGVKVADGSWRKKRGVDEALVAQVEARLKQAMGAPVPNGSPAPQASGSPTSLPAPSAAVAAPALPSAMPAGFPNGVALPTPPASPAPVPPTAAPTATAGAPIDFVQLIGKIAPLSAAGKLTQDELVAICNEVGLAGGLPMLAVRPDLVPTINARIDALLIGR